MADSDKSGGWGGCAVVAILVIGGAFLYQREGGKLAGPGGVIDVEATWAADKPHPTKPNVISGQKTNTWSPAPGYTWVNPGSGDLLVKWTPDHPHPARDNVVAGPTPGDWEPAAGYTWAEAGRKDQVKWSPGRPHPKHPNVVAADNTDQWLPAEGYEWVVSPPPPGELRVKPHDELKQITSGWDNGAFTHDVLFTNGSGADLYEVNVTVTLYRNDGVKVPITRYWASWAKGETVRINVPAHAYQKRTMTGYAHRDKKRVKIDLMW